jgi:membrane-associated phospholipid phosphatase
MKKVKAMYRPQIILARNISIELPLRRSSLLLFVLPLLKARHLRLLCIFSAASLVLLVGFTRIALGAHFLTDVLAAIFFGIIWLMLCTALGKSRSTKDRRVSGSRHSWRGIAALSV